MISSCKAVQMEIIVHFRRSLIRPNLEKIGCLVFCGLNVSCITFILFPKNKMAIWGSTTYSSIQVFFQYEFGNTNCIKLDFMVLLLLLMLFSCFLFFFFCFFFKQLCSFLRGELSGCRFSRSKTIKVAFKI